MIANRMFAGNEARISVYKAFLGKQYWLGVISHMQIPLVDLRSQYLTIKQEIMAAFEDVLESMDFISRPTIAGLYVRICGLLCMPSRGGSRFGN